MTTLHPRRAFIAAAGGTALSLVTGPGHADRPPVVDRNVDRNKAERYQLPREGSDINVGGAKIAIHRPLDDVLKVVMSFRKYHQILPRLETSKLVARGPEYHDVYMRAPILRGMYNIWTVARFTEPLPHGRRGKKVLGAMRKGNLEAFDGRWQLHPCSDKRTILRLELYLIPKVPVPSAWITPELMWAADKGVTAVRDLAECGKSSVKGD